MYWSQWDILFPLLRHACSFSIKADLKSTFYRPKWVSKCFRWVYLAGDSRCTTWQICRASPASQMSMFASPTTYYDSTLNYAWTMKGVSASKTITLFSLSPSKKTPTTILRAVSLSLFLELNPVLRLNVPSHRGYRSQTSQGRDAPKWPVQSITESGSISVTTWDTKRYYERQIFSIRKIKTQSKV